MDETASRQGRGGRTLWITGAGSGLGRHLVGAGLARGHNVFATDLNWEALQEAAAADRWGKRVALAAQDTIGQAAWRSALRECLERFGSVDVLMNVAGVLRTGPLMDTNEEDFDFHFDVNAKGVLTGCRVVGEHMVERKQGHLINIASVAGLVPVPGLGLYSASKFAVRSLSIALAVELKKTGVAVTVVCPDAIETPMLSLQKDKAEAALTFSGDRVLTVEDCEKAIYGPVMTDRPLEFTLPRSRGYLLKAANAFPALNTRLLGFFERKGKTNQEKARAAEAQSGRVS